MGARSTISTWTYTVAALMCTLLLAACAGAKPAPSVDPATPSQFAASSTIAASNSSVPQIPADWRMYTDPALGYSLRFPRDVEFSSGASRTGVFTARLQFSMPGVDGYQGMILRVEPNPNRAGIEQVAEDFYSRNLLAEPPSNWFQDLRAVSAAGLAGVQLGQGPDFSLIVPYEDKVYIIAPVHDTATPALDPQALALFYQILTTLKVSP